MVILDVIPLIPLPRNQPQIVSYYHPEARPRGTVVRVLFNNRKIKAVVIGSASLAERKLQFKKQAGFTLKKIEKIFPKLLITDYQLQKARELSEYYIAPLGICLRAVMLHPDEKNYKKYISPGPSLDLPELETLYAVRYTIRVVDMRREIRDANYSIFSRDLKEALQIAHEKNEKIIIFIPRLGYHNLIICEDCGNAIQCPNCSVSLIPSLRGSTPQLLCHHCNHQEPSPKNCPVCKSFKLKPRGVGIEKVEAELIKFFKYQNLKVPKIEKLTSETPRFPLTVRGDAGGILLATQAIFKFNHLLHVPFLAIMNADALIHIPDFRAEEMLLRQTLTLTRIADHTLIQTYNPDDPALVAAAKGDIRGFWDRELAHRKQFGYPPYTKLIKLTYRHRDSRIAQRIAQEMVSKLRLTIHDTRYTIHDPYPALIFRERGYYIWNVLLKIKDQNSNIKNELQNLPSDWQIDVDPISIV